MYINRPTPRQHPSLPDPGRPPCGPTSLPQVGLFFRLAVPPSPHTMDPRQDSLPRACARTTSLPQVGLSLGQTCGISTTRACPSHRSASKTEGFGDATCNTCPLAPLTLRPPTFFTFRMREGGKDGERQVGQVGQNQLALRPPSGASGATSISSSERQVGKWDKWGNVN